MLLTMASRESIHELATWQFWRHTQSPLSCAFDTISSAIGPWPWPSEQKCNLSPGTQPILVANLWSIAVGSAPVERMKMMGTRLLVSGNTSSRVHGGASVKALPSSAPMYCCADATALSSLKTFTTASLIKYVSLSSQPPGIGSWNGESDSAQASNSADLAAISAVNPVR